jgi:DNA-binding NarL/FixJ family response regulator
MTQTPGVGVSLPAALLTSKLPPTKAMQLHHDQALSTGLAKRPDKMKKIIRVFLPDDHPIVRKGISSCLARHDHLEIIGEAENGAEALRKVRELNPDIILMDIDMPGTNGLQVTEALHRENPKIKVIVLSMHNQPDYVVRVVQSGARGYVLKDASTEELLRAIELVNNGDSYFSPDVARLALNQFIQGSAPNDKSDLTNREREVLTLIADGLSNKEIATRLGVGVRTVETHRERVMRKLDIHSVAGLTRYAISKGWIKLEQDLQ